MFESGAVHLHRELVAVDALVRDAVNLMGIMNSQFPATRY
jgi:hypothetical protein